MSSGPPEGFAQLLPTLVDGACLLAAPAGVLASRGPADSSVEVTGAERMLVDTYAVDREGRKLVARGEGAVTGVERTNGCYRFAVARVDERLPGADRVEHLGVLVSRLPLGVVLVTFVTAAGSAREVLIR